MSKLNSDEIKQLILGEIGWCQLNPESEGDEKYRKGFIAGLIQSHRLIEGMEAKLNQLKGNHE